MDMAIGDVGNYSAVYAWTAEVDQDGNYVLGETDPFGPVDPNWSYTSPDLYSFYSAFISGAQRLENGHTLITEGMRGRIFEID